jgi:hypothetical protein
MRSLVSAELLKLRSTRSAWIPFASSPCSRCFR